ncbi:MAG TPA: translation initiation factor IF-2 subunit gamma [archaeon]|nr:translation initiation factor IF-2 subunit gamma [archaeon]
MPLETNPKLIPELNIGTLGHVDHGKSTLVEALTGKWTASHSEELKRGITIKLGYADATIYKCSTNSHLTTTPKCLSHNCECAPERTVSFVDAPGHETLMATVLAGASLMDGVLFMIAANEKCPAPQTAEHLAVLQIVGQKNIIIVQNKIDTVTAEQAKKNFEEIKNFVNGSVAEGAPIIPMSSQLKINLDILLETIQEKFSTPKRDSSKPPKMLCVRSFDINKPGSAIEKISGGIIGGALVEGNFSLGQEIEIRPGAKFKDRMTILKTKITGLQKAGKNLEEAGPGGLLGVGTDLDPALTKADTLAGSVVGLVGKLPPVISKLTMQWNLFQPKSGEKFLPPQEKEQLMISVGTARTVGIVKNFRKGLTEFDLKLPICAAVGERAVLSRRVGDRWRLIGWGALK